MASALKKAEGEALADKVGPFKGDAVSIGETVLGGVIELEKVTRGVGDIETVGQGEEVRLPPFPVVLVCDTDKLGVLEGGLEPLLEEDSVTRVVALEEEEPLSDESNESEGGEVGELLLEGV